MRRVRGERRLKARDIGKLAPGMHDDGGGLRLQVEPSGARHWLVRYTIAGKRRTKGLGTFPLVRLERCPRGGGRHQAGRAQGRGRCHDPRSVTFARRSRPCSSCAGRSCRTPSMCGSGRPPWDLRLPPPRGQAWLGHHAQRRHAVLEPIWSGRRGGRQAPAAAHGARPPSRRSCATIGRTASPCIGVGQELGTGRGERSSIILSLPYAEVLPPRRCCAHATQSPSPRSASSS